MTNQVNTAVTTPKWRPFRGPLAKPLLPVNAQKNPGVSFKLNRWHLVYASLTINLLALALPIMTLQVYDRILVSQNKGTVYVLVAGVCVAVLLDAILRLTRAYIINWSGVTYEHSLSCNSMRHMLSSDLRTIEKQSVGEQLQRMTSTSRLRDFLSGQSFITLIDLPFVLIFLGLIYYLAGPLVIVPVGLLIVFILFAWRLGLKLKSSLAEREKIDEQRLGFLIETFQGIHTVKSLGLEAMLMRRYEKFQFASSVANYFVAKDNGTASNYGSLFTQAMIIGVIGYGTPMAMNGQLTLGTLIACVMLSGRIMNPIQRALSIWTRYQDYQLNRDNVCKTFELPTVNFLPSKEHGEKLGQLELKDVSFSFGEGEEPLFKNVNLKLERGQSISISGGQSSNTTTLLKVMAGLYAPTSGEVLINNKPALLHRSHYLAQHIGYLSMDSAIFCGTIWDNLTGFGEIPEHRVREIIALLHLDKEIIQLPSGFSTKLEGSTSDPIPPGLKQRICLARVLSPKPRILLYDNADRSLDKQGYNQIYKLLGRLKNKVAMVIASDDNNILRLTEKEYELVDGNLKERAFSDASKNFGVVPFQELRL